LSELQQKRLSEYILDAAIGGRDKPSVFSSAHNLGRANSHWESHYHHIDTGHTAPRTKAYEPRLNPRMNDMIDNLVQERLDLGVIEPSHSPWRFPVVLTPKQDGSMRLCIDYRRLNEVTLPDAYRLPRQEDTMDALGGSTTFSVLDLSHGFHQLPLDKSSRPKTAFSTRRGLYQWTTVPFGIRNGPAAFQRLLDSVLAGLTFECCLLYLDDIIVYSKTFDEHLLSIDKAFTAIRSAGLKLNAKKCAFGVRRVSNLGHVISKDGVEVDSHKVQAVRNFPVPKNTTEVRAFHGMCNYFRRFIPNFGEIAKPLTSLCKTDIKLQWTNVENLAFENLKSLLCTAPGLAYPDFNERFFLATDASTTGLGVVIYQLHNNTPRPIAFVSHAFNATELNWSIPEKELDLNLLGLQTRNV
jgi:Reverse transcriptase (RNA-dependent DNA polymerase)/RNase H-like domain found in reverse transcriptase